MTTPPTTAGWYPDPDGSGGQRYWDGAAWTDQGPEAVDTPAADEETSAWPAELPPWPEDMEMPSWEDAGKLEPAETSEPATADAPDTPHVEPEPEPASAEETGAGVEEAVAEATPEAPEPEMTAPAVTTPEVIEPAVATPEVTVPAVPVPEMAMPAEPPPAAFAAAPAPASPLKGYLIGVGALLVVLIGVLVWAFAFTDPGTATTEATGADESSEATGTTGAATDSAAPTESAAAEVTGTDGQVVDGDVTITSKGVEITPTVAAVDNEMLTKTAAGEFVVVRLTLLNNGELPATFLADQQVLTAGGQIYNTETESTFYLGGISAVLNPGEPVDVAVAFDVPPGTAPESVQVHGDLGSPGAILPLS